MKLFHLSEQIKSIPKQSFRYRKNGKGYTPAKQKKYQDYLSWAFKAKYPKADPFTEPVIIGVIVYRKVLSGSNTKQSQMLKGLVKPTTRPDVDNCLKPIFDSLNKLAYLDDSQITTCLVSKRYDKHEHIEIMIVEDNKKNLLDLFQWFANNTSR